MEHCGASCNKASDGIEWNVCSCCIEGAPTHRIAVKSPRTKSANVQVRVYGPASEEPAGIPSWIIQKLRQLSISVALASAVLGSVELVVECNETARALYVPVEFLSECLSLLIPLVFTAKACIGSIPRSKEDEAVLMGNSHQLGKRVGTVPCSVAGLNPVALTFSRVTMQFSFQAGVLCIEMKSM